MTQKKQEKENSSLLPIEIWLRDPCGFRLSLQQVTSLLLRLWITFWDVLFICKRESQICPTNFQTPGMDDGRVTDICLTNSKSYLTCSTLLNILMEQKKVRKYGTACELTFPGKALQCGEPRTRAALETLHAQSKKGIVNSRFELYSHWLFYIHIVYHADCINVFNKVCKIYRLRKHVQRSWKQAWYGTTGVVSISLIYIKPRLSCGWTQWKRNKEKKFRGAWSKPAERRVPQSHWEQL